MIRTHYVELSILHNSYNIFVYLQGISEANIEPTIGTEITEDQIGQSQGE